MKFKEVIQNRGKFLIFLVFLLATISFVSAVEQPYGITVTAYNSSSGYAIPNTAFNYEFNFTQNSDCTGLIAVFSKTVTTDNYGSQNVTFDFTGYTNTSSINYLCVSRDGVLKEVDPALIYFGPSGNIGGNLNVTNNATIGSNFTFFDSVLKRLGIGTLTPQNILNVIGDGNFTGNLYSRGGLVSLWSEVVNGTVLSQSTYNTNYTSLFTLFNQNNTFPTFTNLNVTGTSYLGNVVLTSTNVTTDNIISKSGDITFFDSTPTPNMIIKSGGNVGIGTISPGLRFDVSETALNTNPAVFRYYSNGSNVNSANAVLFDNNDNTSISLGGIRFRMADDGGTARNAGGIYMGKDQNWNSTASTRDGYMVFGTTLDSVITERMRLTSTGDLGIGTSSPSTLLHTYATNANNQLRIETATATYDPKIELKTSDDQWTMYVDQSDSNNLKFYNGGDLVTIDTAGKVGIGTSSPSQMLDIAGSSPRIELNDTDTKAYSLIDSNTASGDLIFSADVGNTVASSNLRFYVDGSEKARIDSSGNVGIGTSNPVTALTLAGYQDITGTNRLVFGTYVSATNHSAWIANGAAGYLDIVSGYATTYATSNGIGFGIANGASWNRKMTLTSAGLTVVNDINSTAGNLNINSGNAYISGNVGIGTSSPLRPLDVAGPITANSTIFTSSTDSFGQGLGGGITFGGKYNSAGTPSVSFATIQGAKATAVDGNQAGYLAFSTKSTSSIMTERMRIDQAGNVGIGTITPQNTLNVVGNANVTGTFYLTNSGTKITSNSTCTKIFGSTSEFDIC